MDNYWIYNFRSIYSNQIQAKINNFFIQLNDPNILGKITKISLRNLQDREWLARDPLVEFPFDRIAYRNRNCYIFNMLYLCKQNNITFNITPEKQMNIEGGKITIRELINQEYHRYKRLLRKDSILYLDQIITPDKQKLLNYRDIITIHNISTNVRKEGKHRWYQWIKEKLTYNEYIIPDIYFKITKIHDVTYNLRNLQIIPSQRYSKTVFLLFYHP